MSILHGVALVMSLSGLSVQSTGVTYCRPFDDTREIQHQLERYALAISGDNATVRDSLRIPKAQVIVQTLDQKICKNANTAYKTALSGHGTGLTNQVVVISFNGYGVYAVYDPNYRYGSMPFLTIVIFDSRWRKLSIFHS